MLWKAYKLLRAKQLTPSKKMIVVISGCDSGLGFQTAVTASNAGLTVIAGLYGGIESEAAKTLLSMCPKYKPHLINLDITNDKSVAEAADCVSSIINSNSGSFLHAVVNNAGLMIFGNFEWQTEKQIQIQFDVNVMGTLRFTKAMLPLFRQSTIKNVKPRLVIVNSHCSIQQLPLLSVYGATKTCLKGWSEALRMELKLDGIDVVDFIPGSMLLSTAITEKQKMYTAEMKDNFTEGEWSHHGRRFDSLLTSYIDRLSFTKPPNSLKDDILMEKMMSAVLDSKPRSEYKHQPWRYAFYHPLFQIAPIRLRHWLVTQFVIYWKNIKNV